MKNETLGQHDCDLQRNLNRSELKITPLLLGNGKLAKHLHHYFHLLNLPHQHYENARDLTSPELHRKLEGVNAIWILTSDRSISEVKRELSRHTQKAFTWIHSSAATDVEGMVTLHPLMTFGENLYTREEYERIPFALIGTPKIDLDLPNPTFVIAPEKRSLYHAFAVLMSNLPVILWSMTAHESQQTLDVPVELFHPILNQTLKNFTLIGPKALTGPIVRGDQTTIDKNLTALKSQNDHLAHIYQTFLTAFQQKGAQS